MSAEYDPSVQGNAWDEENEEYGVEDGINHSANPQLSSHQEQPHFSLEQDPRASGDVVPSASDDDGDSDEAGDYDPEMVTSSVVPTSHVAEPQAASKPSPKPQAKKPKTAGGFIVDSDSEDEDDEASAPESGGLPVPTSSLHTHAHTASPLQASVAVQEIASPTASNQAHPNMARDAPSAPPVNSHAPVVSAPEASAQPQVAQDKIAVLENRVREDPRGAMDSWVALLREYQDRNKIDDARNAYGRFLDIFPQAVSTPSLWLLPLCWHVTDTCSICRLIFGPTTSIWS